MCFIYNFWYEAEILRKSSVTIHALGTTFRSQNFKPTPKSP